MEAQAGNPPAQPSFFLTHQQLQMLQYLQQKQTNLNSQEELLLQQLNSQYKLMEEYQHGVIQKKSSEGLVKSHNSENKVSHFETERANLPPPYSNTNSDPSFSKFNNDNSKYIYDGSDIGKFEINIFIELFITKYK